MAGRVVYEYDPATGRHVARSLADDLADLAPGQLAGTRLSAPGDVAARRLSKAGKAKVKKFVTQAKTLEELADVDAALNSGVLSEALAARLSLGEDDFEAAAANLLDDFVPVQPAAKAVPTAALVQPAPEPPLPLGAMGLTAAGLTKVRLAIQMATNEQLLEALDRALNQGDIPKLRQMLALQPEDIVNAGADDAADDAASDGGLTEGSPVTDEDAEGTESEAADEEDDYDPFSEKPKAAVTRPEGLSALGAYDESSEDEAEQPAKKRKQEVKAKGKAKGKAKDKAKQKVLAWPVSWAWLLSRAQSHADYRAPQFAQGCRYVPERADGEEARPGPLAVMVAVSLVYAGDAATGYDPKHLARIAAVDDHGEVLLNVLVRPRAPLLDCRTHLTGLTREMLEGPGAVDIDEAVRRLLTFLRPETLLVGYRLGADLEAMNLWHRPLVDVALLFDVETRKQHQYHPLRHIAAHVLGEELPEQQPHDALEVAHMIARLVRHEVSQQTPTRPFAPRAGSNCELIVRHVPREWGQHAVDRVAALCPGAAQGFAVNWLLNESDPSDWRGEACLTFPSTALRDAAFDAAPALTDVHVQWSDSPGAPPLGAFLTEQALVEAFSSYGIVVAARIPRKALTREPQSFAFVSFLAAEDAQRVGKKPKVEVEITSTWKVACRPRVARYGQGTDKRVAVKAKPTDDEWSAYEWVHLCKR